MTISGGIIGKPGILSRAAGTKMGQAMPFAWSNPLWMNKLALFGFAYFRRFEDHEDQVEQDAENAAKTIAGMPLGNR